MNGGPVVVGDCVDELIVEVGEVVDIVELAEVVDIAELAKVVLYPAGCVEDT